MLILKVVADCLTYLSIFFHFLLYRYHPVVKFTDLAVVLLHAVIFGLVDSFVQTSHSNVEIFELLLLGRFDHGRAYLCGGDGVVIVVYLGFDDLDVRIVCDLIFMQITDALF